MRVLIADPDEIWLEECESYFAVNGILVATAINGPECVEALDDFDPDVLVLNPELFSNGGDRVLERLCDDKHLPKIRVLLVGAGPKDDLFQYEREFPVDGYAEKPLSPAQLARQICLLPW